MQIKKSFDLIIGVIFSILLGISIIGGVIKLYQLTFYNLITCIILVIAVLIIILLLYINLRYPNIIINLIVKGRSIKKEICWFGFGLTIIWQLLMTNSLIGDSWWDPQILSKVAAHYQIEDWMWLYFSTYPNNFFLLAIEYLIWKLLLVVGIHNYWSFLGVLSFLNFLLVDVSLVLLFRVIKSITKRSLYAYFATTLLWILIGLTPFSVIAYSDIPALFVNSLLLFLLIKLKNNIKKKWLVSFIFGITLCIGYLIKPTVMVFAIALLVVFVLDMRRFRKQIPFFVIVMIGFALVLFPEKYVAQHNNLVSINTSQAIPMNHFIAMGLHGNGGFYQKDVTINQNIKNPRARKAYNQQLIKKRLKQKGLLGYARFLVKKQILNTNDASFAWGVDGKVGFLVVSHRLKKTLTSLPRKIYMDFLPQNKWYVANREWHGLIIVVQIVWILLLMSLLSVINNTDSWSTLLKLTIVGAWSFLLLFEGGRSRYLVQFLPYFVVLSGIGISKLRILARGRKW